MICKISESVARRCSVKKVFLKISQNSQKNTCASLFFNKVAGLMPAIVLKKRLQYKCLPVNFAKFLRTPFLKEHLRQLLLRFRTAWSFKMLDILSLYNNVFSDKALVKKNFVSLQVCLQFRSKNRFSNCSQSLHSLEQDVFM